MNCSVQHVWMLRENKVAIWRLIFIGTLLHTSTSHISCVVCDMTRPTTRLPCDPAFSCKPGGTAAVKFG
jgi:hypothetical protein